MPSFRNTLAQASQLGSQSWSQTMTTGKSRVTVTRRQGRLPNTGADEGGIVAAEPVFFELSGEDAG